MGAIPPRRPLPPTATKAELIADIMRIKREIMQYRIMTALIYGASLVAVIAIAWMMNAS